jgi:hypothetical protein
MIEEPRKDWEGTPLRMLYSHYLSSEQVDDNDVRAGSIRQDWEGTPLRTLYSHYLRTEKDEQSSDYPEG